MDKYDLVLNNARILDGCGTPWFYGDVGIFTGKITCVAQPHTLKGKHMIDLDGRFLTPGIIDIHTHSDLSILINRQAESVIRQGVTTHVLGNCGMSPAPLNTNRMEEMHTFWGSIAYALEISWEWSST